MWHARCAGAHSVIPYGLHLITDAPSVPVPSLPRLHFASRVGLLEEGEAGLSQLPDGVRTPYTSNPNGGFAHNPMGEEGRSATAPTGGSVVAAAGPA